MKVKSLKIESIVRELTQHPEVPVAGQHIYLIMESLLNRPLQNELPDVDLLRLIVSRMLSDENRLKELERTPFKPGISLLQYIHEAIGKFKQWEMDKPS